MLAFTRMTGSVFRVNARIVNSSPRLNFWLSPRGNDENGLLQTFCKESMVPTIAITFNGEQRTCQYSRATRGNIDLTVTLV